MKRYFGNEFKMYSGYDLIEKGGRRHGFLTCVEEFIQGYMPDVIQEMTRKGLSQSDVKFYIAFLVCPDMFKKSKGHGPYLEQYRRYHQCMYSFSKSRLNTLIQDNTFRHLFTHFVDSGKFETFLTSDTTLIRHRELYMEAKDELLTMIRENKRVHKR